ncbi:hypothetical protein F6P79_03640 [Streptococcus suis]|uniref:hypothetical protein n=1 Tax=Streptococcus suis TaxID=1307 RepID=UPI001EE7A00A|nr:hypothetical protein [Streptococcus suis]MBS8085653.1 hypothetical protein [Streptococcus suis]
MEYRKNFSRKNPLLSDQFSLTGIIFELNEKLYVKEIQLSKDEFQYISDLFKIQCVLKYKTLDKQNGLHYKQDNSRKSNKLLDSNIYNTLNSAEKDKIGFPRKKNNKHYSPTYLEKILSLKKINEEFVFQTVNSDNFRVLLNKYNIIELSQKPHLQTKLNKMILHMLRYKNNDSSGLKEFESKFFDRVATDISEGKLQEVSRPKDLYFKK